MYTIYAEIKLNKQKYGEARPFLTVMFWVMILNLVYVLLFPFYCELYPKYSPNILQFSLVVMFIYGFVRSSSLILPPQFSSRASLILHWLTILLILAVTFALKGDLAGLSCYSIPSGILLLLVAASLPVLAADGSYLLGIFFRRIRKGEEK